MSRPALTALFSTVAPPEAPVSTMPGEQDPRVLLATTTVFGALSTRTAGWSSPVLETMLFVLTTVPVEPPSTVTTGPCAPRRLARA